MTVLPNAPLIEAIFEIKWGDIQQPSPNEHRYEEKLSNSQLLPGQLSSVASSKGYPFTETLTNNPPLPFLPRFRYRNSITSWPCFQLGTGIFTVNQIKEGYSGHVFKDSVIQGLQMLEAVLPNSLASLPLISIELKYQDGMSSERKVTREFIQSSLNFEVTPPPQLLDHPNCDEQSFACNRFEVESKLTIPKGSLKISMDKAIISGKEGILLTSSVLSLRSELDSGIKIALLSEWFDESHSLLKHTFDQIFTDKAHKGFS